MYNEMVCHQYWWHITSNYKNLYIGVTKMLDPDIDIR